MRRAKRAEVEQEVLELQAREEEHLLEANGQTGGGTSRLDRRRQKQGSLPPQGGVGSRASPKPFDARVRAESDGNRSAALDALRQKLAEAHDFNLQLEQRLRRAEETLAAVSAARPPSGANLSQASEPQATAAPPPSTPPLPPRTAAHGCEGRLESPTLGGSGSAPRRGLVGPGR